MGQQEDMASDRFSNSNSQGNNDFRNQAEETQSRPPASGDKLFIEVDDFQNIKEQVEEMKYLSREAKDLMSNLEEGLDRDRRVEGEIQDVLKDFSDRRESIQSSIK